MTGPLFFCIFKEKNWICWKNLAAMYSSVDFSVRIRLHVIDGDTWGKREG
jgi:hypothetical protein